MSRPGAFALATQAKNFVLARKDLLKKSFIMYFPPMYLINVVNIMANSHGIPRVELAMLFPMLYLYAGYVLTWHRASLIGDSNLAVVNPTQIQKEDSSFIIFFMVVMGIFSVLMGAASVAPQILPPETSKGVALSVSVGALVLLIVSIYAFLKISFFLPARSVGVILSWQDLRLSSKGMIGPLVGANMLFGLLFMVIFVVYLLVIGISVSVVTGGTDPAPTQMAIISSIVTLPLVAATLVLIALGTTALSKAYQWGMENNFPE